MREFGVIHTTFWTWCQDNQISDTGRTLAAFLLSSNHSNSLGCYRLPLAYISNDLGYSIERVLKGFMELEKHSFAYYDQATAFLIIPNYLKFNPIQNSNHGKKVAKLALAVPEKFQYIGKLVDVLATYHGHLNGKAFDTLHHTLSERYRNNDQDQDQDKIPPPAKPAKAETFVLPDWVDSVLWGEFEKMRKNIKAPMTDHARKVNLFELERLIKAGHDQTAVINQTVAKGWKGFFPVKDALSTGTNDVPVGPKRPPVERICGNCTEYKKTSKIMGDVGCMDVDQKKKACENFRCRPVVVDTGRPPEAVLKLAEMVGKSIGRESVN